MLKKYTKDSLDEYTKNNKFIIYGTGIIAKIFYNHLKKNKVTNNILAFASSGSYKSSYYMNKPLLSIDELKEYNDILICIASQERVNTIIQNELEKRELYNYVWIRPYLESMVFGPIIQKDEMVDVESLIRQYNDYRFALRWLAMENYYNNNNIGYNLYIRSREICSSHDSAMSRLGRYVELIKDFEKKNPEKFPNIRLCRDLKIIDGCHRVVLAKYLNVNKLRADIHEFNYDRSVWDGVDDYCTKEYLSYIGFNNYELSELDRVYHMLRNEK